MSDDIEYADGSVVASSIVTDYIQDYGKYVAATKFSSLIDGLKVGQRRILWELQTVTEKRKLLSVVGAVTEHHPHGDRSIEDTLVRLGQPFNTLYPLVYIRGNVGSYSGNAASHGRYLDVSSSEFTREVYFNGVDRATLPMIKDDTGSYEEPKYLVPKIPMSLITGAHTLAVGFMGKLPIFSLEDVVNMTIRYIRLRRRNALPSTIRSQIKQYIRPELFTPVRIRNLKEVQDAFERDEHPMKIVCDGTIKITPKHLTLMSVPPTQTNIYDTYMAMYKKLGNKDNFVVNNFIELLDRSTKRKVSKDGIVSLESGAADFRFVLRRGADPASIINEFKKQVKFTRTCHFPIYGLNAENVLTKTNILGILEFWYEARCKSILAEYRRTQNRNILNYRRISAILLVKDHDKEIVEIIRTSKTTKQAQEIISKRFNISIQQAEYITSSSLDTLVHKKKQDLELELKRIRKELSGLKSRFTKVDDRIIEDMQAILKKFGGRPRNAIISEYKGWVKVNKSLVIMLEDDFEDILATWGSQISHFQLGQMGSHVTYIDEGITFCMSVNELPKEFTATDIWSHDHNIKYTGKLIPNRAVFCIGDAHSEDGDLVKLSDGDHLIYRDGHIETAGPDSIKTFKGVKGQGVVSSIIGVVPSNSTHLICLQSSMPSVVSIIPLNEKHKFLPMGDIKILGGINAKSGRIGKYIPRKFRKRGSAFLIEFESSKTCKDSIVKLKLNQRDKIKHGCLLSL